MTSTSTMTKVTSIGSPCGAPSVPNATPATEALDSSVVDPPPPMDFGAVTRILNLQTDFLNEKADEAMYPSPPINTPIVGSPTPSAKWSIPGRGRGLSIVGDRLAQMKIDNRKHRHYHHRDTDITSSSFSIEPSLPEECEECEMASVSEVVSDGCKDKACPGHASRCSPAVNPRIAEYLSFTSKDLPTQAPPPANGTTLAEHASVTSTTALDGDSQHSRVSLKSDGVTEKSNWAEELEDSLDRTCLRLEQLAQDEHTANPSKSVEEYYVTRLRRYLSNKDRQVPVSITEVLEDEQTTEEK